MLHFTLELSATLVTSADDIVETLAPILGRAAKPGMELSSCDERETPRPSPQIDQNERDIVQEALGPSPIDVDEIIRSTVIETRKVHIILLELDLAGRLQRHNGQLVSLVE